MNKKKEAFYRNVNIHPSIVANGFWKQEYERQMKGLKYDENLYHNENQLNVDQITTMLDELKLDEFKNLSTDDKVLKIKDVIKKIDLIINYYNRMFAYENLLTIYPESLEFIHITYQAENHQFIEKLVLDNPDLKKHIKYKISETEHCKIVSSLYITRSGDFGGGTQVYHKVILPELSEYTDPKDSWIKN